MMEAELKVEVMVQTYNFIHEIRNLSGLFCDKAELIQLAADMLNREAILAKAEAEYHTL